ncbi:MAG: hypothetical protein PHP54_03250 [Clostridia bacterium]|nr:hypothetical protein [Clostridia bacterium]
MAKTKTAITPEVPVKVEMEDISSNSQPTRVEKAKAAAVKAKAEAEKAIAIAKAAEAKVKAEEEKAAKAAAKVVVKQPSERVDNMMKNSNWLSTHKTGVLAALIALLVVVMIAMGFTIVNLSVRNDQSADKVTLLTSDEGVTLIEEVSSLRKEMVERDKAQSEKIDALSKSVEALKEDNKKLHEKQDEYSKRLEALEKKESTTSTNLSFEEVEDGSENSGSDNGSTGNVGSSNTPVNITYEATTENLALITKQDDTAAKEEVKEREVAKPQEDMTSDEDVITLPPSAPEATPTPAPVTKVEEKEDGSTQISGGQNTDEAEPAEKFDWDSADNVGVVDDKGNTGAVAAAIQATETSIKTPEVETIEEPVVEVPDVEVVADAA